MVGLLRILGGVCEIDVDIGVALTVLFTFIDTWHLVAVLAILVVIVMAAIVRVTFLVQVVQDARAIFLHLNDVLVADGEELDEDDDDIDGEPILDDEIDGEEYIFIQGMQGLNGKIRIPFTSGLKNPIINQAQLKLTLATMVPNDATFYSEHPLEQLFLSKKNEDGELIIIADLSTAIEVGSLSGFFGGNLVEKTEDNIVISTYTMNISEHL